MALVSLRLFFFLIFLLNLTLISHHPSTNAQSNDLKRACSVATDIGSSTYQANLKAVLSNIFSYKQTNDYGFYNFSYGNNSDKVNIVALCRGDVTPQDCPNCVSGLGVVLLQMCPNKKEVYGWYEKCLLRCTYRDIFGVMETDPYMTIFDTNDALEKEQFMSAVTQMMDFLRDRAASGNSTRKFAAANATGPSNQKIYGVAQCTPDLSGDDCRACLNVTISRIPECCDGMRGGRVASGSCLIRYESYMFFDAAAAQPFTSFLSTPSPPPSFDQPVSKQGKSNTSEIVIAVVVSTVAVIAFAVVILIAVDKGRRRRLKNIETWEDEEDKDEIITVDSLQMDFDTIRLARNDFSEANKLGQGGFGSVYLGRLFNGQEIAVKRLSRNSGQGDTEFKNEVLSMAKLQHRNLVKLFGFCLQNRERLLVYEFVPNKSLDCFIFDPIERATLNWEKRFKIIEGISRGLLYLHQDSRVRIIHRDLKPSNILLDKEMNAKISDFGMARLFAIDQTQGNTNTIVGTYGYIAPEYIRHGIFSTKSDVFSFGVLVLEIISGKRNAIFRSRENIAEHIGAAAWKSWRKGILSSIVDPMLMEDAGYRNEVNGLMRCIQIGLLCVQESARDRPSMGSIVTMLSTFSSTLPIPLEPSFYILSSTQNSIESSSSGGDQSMEGSRNEVSISEQYPR